MPRDLKAHEQHKKSASRRAHALARLDLREPTVPRVNAVGAFSHAVKVMDPESQRLISEALAARGIVGTRT
jgi:hypothetical protein